MTGGTLIISGLVPRTNEISSDVAMDFDFFEDKANT